MPIEQLELLVPDPYFKLRSPEPTPPDELCTCLEVEPIKLMCALGYNPVHCMDCNLEVPPERLGFDAQLAEEIAVWRRIHDAVYQLWLDSGEYEAWAQAELSDITSPTNRRGRALQPRLNHRRRCYYWYFQDQSAEDYEPIEACPACGQPLLAYTRGIFRQLVCERCSIVTVGE